MQRKLSKKGLLRLHATTMVKLVVFSATCSLGPQLVQAEPTETCVKDFADPFHVAASSISPTEYRDGCLHALEESEQPDALNIAARIRIATGEYEIASRLLENAARQGSNAARLPLQLLEMAEFEDRYPEGWISSEAPGGIAATYVLSYTNILRAARSLNLGEDHLPLLSDFMFGHDPSRGERLLALKSLLDKAGSGGAGAPLAQRLLGMRLDDGSIAPDMLREPEVVHSLNELLSTQDNLELIWWTGCAGSLAYIYQTASIRVLGKEIASTDPRSLLETALKVSEESNLASETDWRFRRALFNLEDTSLPTGSLNSEISELELLSSLGHRHATQYLDDAAVGEVIGAYSMTGFGLATDLCGQETRIVFDSTSALNWWSSRIEAADCGAIGDLVSAERHLSENGRVRELPKITKSPMQLLVTCRSLMDSRYLNLW
jgi:hypothetical protein